MKSSIAVAVAVAVAALGCTTPLGKPIDASNTADASNPGDASNTADAPDAAACECHVEGSGYTATLVMSWSCYCAAFGDGCTRQPSSQCSQFRERIDYPGCGLTAIHFEPAGGPFDDVFDRDGKLVGARAASDTSPYKCPSDPSLTGYQLRAGRLPEATCEAVACGTCSTVPASFPCSPADGGAGQ